MPVGDIVAERARARRDPPVTPKGPSSVHGQAVIIGGGVGGTCIVDHLAERGRRRAGAPLGMVAADVERFGRWAGFEVVREPLDDPVGARIRA